MLTKLLFGHNLIVSVKHISFDFFVAVNDFLDAKRK